jgi:hypothetical protein
MSLGVDCLPVELLADELPREATILGKVGKAVAIHQERNGSLVLDLPQAGKRGISLPEAVSEGVG